MAIGDVQFDQMGEAAICQVEAVLTSIRDVEEKFEKYFGYLARCEGKFCATTPKILKNQAKINQNARKMPSKFENRALKTLFEI